MCTAVVLGPVVATRFTPTLLEIRWDLGPWEVGGTGSVGSGDWVGTPAGDPAGRGRDPSARGYARRGWPTFRFETRCGDAAMFGDGIYSLSSSNGDTNGTPPHPNPIRGYTQTRA